MPLIRNTATRDLEVAGRIYPAGETVEVGPGEAEYLASNPNFATVGPPADAPAKPETTEPAADPPAGETTEHETTERPRRAGKKATR